ncbi:hypothetical protein M422DRAFT_258011 [Sphaerobolus stellatus SS14]|uniref:HTH CENPB-type domain-containing protein n=1 Tax=Sphaerobolus stellatus (strain SS14) TaxID=990650 RepID=A0A0C9VC40_SPHS4|nr:hypothetical protein M422DRAFT_258011 [Sphaerobolus stellatus SS14]
MPTERPVKRKPRDAPAPYKCQTKPGPKPGARDAPKTTAKPLTSKKRENLTLHDWMTVFAFIDEHPRLSQDDIPDVERALALWVHHMEEKGETVNGPMLAEKCGRFEEAFGVLKEERLTGDRWVPSFCRAYNIKERRRHGEAGSVDLVAVEAECIHVRAILARYPPENIYNFNETSLFAFAPPDRGLATKQMSGKKSDKFRITLSMACNSDGSDKLPLLFIGRSMKPRWIKTVDQIMGRQNRKIILLLDNFSGHYILYQPKNIQIEFFEPNLTSFVQPCDAGIIQCFKAHYRQAFCSRDLDLDEAGGRDIYKVNLLEAMLMAKKAWDEVTGSTVAHCWNHTQILPSTSHNPVPVVVPGTSSNLKAYPQTPQQDPQAWMILHNFATSNMGLPEAEEKLQAYLGSRYDDKHWWSAFKAVMDAENDAMEALKSLDKLTRDLLGQPISQLHEPATLPPIWQHISSEECSAAPQLSSIEGDLQRCVDELKKRNRIIGKPLTLEEMLNPIEEKTIGFSTFQFEGGDEEIVERVKYDIAVEKGEIIEIESDKSDEEEEQGLTAFEISKMCQEMESLCLRHAPPDLSHDLAQHLRQFRIHLRREMTKNAKQTTLDGWIK